MDLDHIRKLGDDRGQLVATQEKTGDGDEGLSLVPDHKTADEQRYQDLCDRTQCETGRKPLRDDGMLSSRRGSSTHDSRHGQVASKQWKQDPSPYSAMQMLGQMNAWQTRTNASSTFEPRIRMVCSTVWTKQAGLTCLQCKLYTRF